MYVQMVEFELQGMTAAEYEAFCEQAVPAIAQVPGLVGKLFLADAGSRWRAGIYSFADRESADAYLGTELFQTAIAANPAVANLRTRGSDLLESPTRALEEALAAATISAGAK